MASLRIEHVVRSIRASSLCRLNSCRYLLALRVATSWEGLTVAAFLELFATTSWRILEEASPMRSESVAAIILKTRPHIFGSPSSCSLSVVCCMMYTSTLLSATTLDPGTSPSSSVICAHAKAGTSETMLRFALQPPFESPRSTRVCGMS